MTKNDLKVLRERANKCINDVYEAITTLTAEKPFVLFDKNKNKDELLDEIYDLPFGYTVDKYENYLQGAIQQVHGNEVILYLTGEDFGREYHISLSEIPFFSQIELLELIENELL